MSLRYKIVKTRLQNRMLLTRNILLATVLASWGCCDKVPQTRWLKRQGFIGSQFWRLEVLRSGCLQGGFLPRSVRKRSAPGLSPWLVCGHLLPMSLQIVFPLCVSVTVSVSKSPIFMRILVILDYRPHLN